MTNDELSSAVWRKSSRSGAVGQCVEVAFLNSGGIATRDSKNPTGPALVFTPAEWDAFTRGVQAGDFTS